MQPPSHHELSGQSGAGPATMASLSAAKQLPGGQTKNSKRSHGSTEAEDVNGHGDAHQTTPTPAANHLLRSPSCSKPSSSSVGSPQHPSQIRDQQQHHHTRATSHGGKNRSAPTNGHSDDLGSERAQFSGMGDGILNQSMKEDLESKSRSAFFFFFFCCWLREIIEGTVHPNKEVPTHPCFAGNDRLGCDTRTRTRGSDPRRGLLWTVPGSFHV